MLADFVGRATIPLLQAGVTAESPQIEGTGVLVRSFGHVFIYTAAHVLKAFQGNHIYVPLASGQIVRIGGYSNGFLAYDAGVVHLEVPDLNPFLEMALPAGIMYAQSDVLTDRLYLYGYPARNLGSTDLGLKIPPSMYRTRGAPPKLWLRSGLKPENHIVLRRPSKVIGPSGEVDLHRLDGMSGCGVWFAPTVTGRFLSPHDPNPLPRLIGIFTEERKNSGLLVATNVRLHMEAALQMVPSLREQMRPHIEKKIMEQRKRDIGLY